MYVIRVHVVMHTNYILYQQIRPRSGLIVISILETAKLLLCKKLSGKALHLLRI